MGIFGARIDGHLHHLGELGHEMSQEEDALSVKNVFGASFAARHSARHDWPGELTLDVDMSNVVCE